LIKLNEILTTLGLENICMKKIILVAIAGIALVAFTSRSSAGANSGDGRDSMPPQMKQYWLVLLLKGANRDMDKESSARIQTAHLANINRLWKEEKLIMAGPMGYTYDTDLRGIFILDAKDSATAASYIKTDSAIITGRLRFELHPWWTQKGTYIFK
jgi:uncharacterized protein YciI